MELLLAVEPLDVGQLAPVEHTLAYDVYTEVRKPVGDNCVGHRHGGRTVEEDIIVSAAHFGDELVEFVRKEHLRRVGRLHSCVNHVEILVESGVLDHALHIGNRSCEIARDAGFAVAVAQLGRQGMAAQVEVDQQHALAGHGEGHGQIRRHEGLACVRVRRGEENGADVGSGRDAHKRHVRAQNAESLRQGVAARFAHHDPGLAAALVAADVGLFRRVNRRVRQERGARHVVGGDDALDLDALLGDVVFELSDVGEEAGVLDHEAAAVVLDDEHLVVDEVVGLIGMQFNCAKIINIELALRYSN